MEPVVLGVRHLVKRFDGVIEPLMGAVFGCLSNKKDLVSLTIYLVTLVVVRVLDHRMFKDVV